MVLSVLQNGANMFPQEAACIYLAAKLSYSMIAKSHYPAFVCTPVQEVPPSPGGLSGDRDTGAHHLGNACQQQPGKGSAAAYQGQWWLCWWTMPELQFPSVV